MKICFVILLSIGLLSCTSFKNYPIKEREISSKLEGEYINHSDTLNKHHIRSLWSVLDPKYKDSTAENSLVKLEIDPEKKITATLLSADTIRKQIQLKGKFKEDGAFYTKRKFSLVPILPILWWYNHRKNRLYILENQLVVDEIHDRGGAFLIMANGSRIKRQRRYTKQ